MNLTIEQIGVGCEVYVIETKKSYILDEITPVTNAKKWHLEADSEIGSKFVESFSGMFPRAIAERAVADMEYDKLEKLLTDSITYSDKDKNLKRENNINIWRMEKLK